MIENATDWPIGTMVLRYGDTSDFAYLLKTGLQK